MSDQIRYGGQRYQVLFPDLLPALSEDDLRLLEADIGQHGVTVAIVIDEDLGIIDGINRLRIAAAKKLEDVPFDVRSGLTTEQKRDLAWRLNRNRRHLTTEQKREIIAAELRANPQQSNRQVAAAVGASDKTVSKVREDLESVAEIPQQETRPGKDGKKYKAKKPRPKKPNPEPSGVNIRQQAAGEAGAAGAAAPTEREPGDDSDIEVRDAEGTPVPLHALPAFVAAKEITSLCREIDGIVAKADALAKGPGGRLIRIESVKQQLKDAKGNLWANRPTHVCPYCNGDDSSCLCCCGQGWTAKHVWQQAPGNRKTAS